MRIGNGMEYAEAIAHYPVEVDRIRQQMSESRSKYKSVPLEQWQFFYEACYAINTYYNGWDVFSERARNESRERHEWELSAPEDEQVQELDERTHVSLIASYLSPQTGKTITFGVKLGVLPPEVHEHNRESVRRRMASQARFNSLSKEEQGQETANILAQLRRGRGFVEIRRVEK